MPSEIQSAMDFSIYLRHHVSFVKPSVGSMGLIHHSYVEFEQLTERWGTVLQTPR